MDNYVSLRCIIALSAALAFGSGISVVAQTHQGSAITNDFKLNDRNPDARISVAGSNAVVVLNIEQPSRSVVQQEPQYKVSLDLLGMHLCDADDRLKIVYSDPRSIRTATWKLNSSSESSTQLTNIEATQIILIPEGRWTLSAADIVATLYLDSTPDGTCPPNTTPCNCPSGDVSENMIEQQGPAAMPIRCIPTSLVCNGNPNCGGGCQVDEAGTSCRTSTSRATLSSTFSTDLYCSPPPDEKDGAISSHRSSA